MRPIASIANVLPLLFPLAALITPIAGCDQPRSGDRELAAGGASAGNSGEQQDYPLPVRHSPYGSTRLDRPPASAWFEERRRRYADVLARRDFDLLVVPFQTQDFALDAPARSLITHYLVEGLRQRTGDAIPDPDLVSRALGETRRTLDRADVRALAKRLGVGRIVWGWIGHDGNMGVTLSVGTEAPDALGTFGAAHPIELKTWTDIVYSDARPPSEQFLDRLDEVVAAVTPDAAAQPAMPSYPEPAPLPLPGTVAAAFAATSPSPIEAAHRLQLIGALTPPDPDSGYDERLFERSLALLQQADPASADYRLLRARALFYLQRRPAALAALAERGGPSSAEERALQALLDGNLAVLQQQVELIQRPLPRLVALIELTALRRAYHKPKPDAAQLQALARPFGAWAGLLQRRLQQEDAWSVPAAPDLELKQMLDRAFPLPGFSAQDPAHPAIADDALGEFNPRLELAGLEHVQRALEADTLVEPAPGAALSPRDLLDLLEGIAEAAVAKRLQFALETQNQPRRAQQLLSALEPALSGHPMWALYQAKTLRELLPSVPVTMRQASRARIIELVTLAAHRAPGQTWGARDATNIASRLRRPLPLYASDQPSRWYWRQGFGRPLLVPKGAAPRPGSELGIGELALMYAHDRAQLLSSRYRDLLNRGHSAAAARKELDQHRQRFAGHPRYAEIWAEIIGPDATLVERRALYQQGLRDNPDAWANYQGLATLAIEQGHYQAASDTLWRYPQFTQTPGGNRVAVSNRAYQAGSLLFWRGADELAAAFYRLSAELDTGSGGSISSAGRLALLEQRYVDALDHAAQRARRYRDQWGFRDTIALTHLLGEHQEAWSVFDAVRDRVDTAPIWNAAFAGHRMQGATPEQIRPWLLRPGMKRAGASLLNRFALIWALVDRDGEDADPLLDALLDQQGREHPLQACRGQVTLLGEDGKPTTTAIPAAIQARLVQLTNHFDTAALNCADLDRSRWQHFADGYRAAKAGRFDQAYTTLRRYARFFDLRQTQHASVLPYLALSAVQSGQHAALDAYLERPQIRRDNPFEWSLAQAYASAGRGDFQAAKQQLQRAFNLRPDIEDRLMLTWYQAVEAAEWLYQRSGREAFKRLALDWARRYQRIQPWFAWAYAVEARYSEDPAARRRALALALHLDRRSQRVAEMPAQAKQDARAWLAAHHPFIPTEATEAQHHGAKD